MLLRFKSWKVKLKKMFNICKLCLWNWSLKFTGVFGSISAWILLYSSMARTWRFASKELNNEFACSDLQRNLLSHKRIWNIILCCLWPMKNGLGLIKIWVKASRDALKVCFYVSLQMITFIFTGSYLIKVILFWINLRYWLKLLWEFLKSPC